MDTEITDSAFEKLFLSTIALRWVVGLQGADSAFLYICRLILCTEVKWDGWFEVTSEESRQLQIYSKPDDFEWRQLIATSKRGNMDTLTGRQFSLLDQLYNHAAQAVTSRL